MNDRASSPWPIWRPALWALAALALVNLAPYALRSAAAGKVRVKVVQVTRPDGGPLDIVDHGRSLTRQLARKAASAVGLSDEDRETFESFMVKAELSNEGWLDLNILGADYEFEVAGVRLAKGEWRRRRPLTLAAGGKAVVFLPIDSVVETSELLSWSRGRREARFYGQAQLQLGGWQIRAPFSRAARF